MQDKIMQKLDELNEQVKQQNKRLDGLEKQADRQGEILATVIADTLLGVGDFTKAAETQKRKGQEN